jgi:L-lysine 2,3-aminomutase
MMLAYDFNEETTQTIEDEKLLPPGLIARLQKCYPQYEAFGKDEAIFRGKTHYNGLKGFREILDKLTASGIVLENVKEREFFLEVYRFMATKHILNSMDWSNFKADSNYHLIFPEPGMINETDVQKYTDAKSDEERAAVVEAYQLKTNPHDGNQKLNKPFYVNDDCELEILEGSQHKYPPIKLVLDKGTQNCFAFCTYCFRHAQVRGDEDMFVQHDIKQVHNYLKKHKEVSDVLITGGDGGYISYERLLEYVKPLIEDPELIHIRSLRIGSRAITFHPEFLLSNKFKKILELLKTVVDNGIQVVWMAHLSTPRELLNPGAVAAVKRLKSYGIAIKSQSPIMNHISLFRNENGEVDVDKSAQNWIDLGNVLAMLGIGFHSMYCARPTGEHHYFTAPLADISKIFAKVFRSLASINRPSRHITMTSSAGKTSLMGTTHINGEKVFALKFNEARNMEWMDSVYFAKYDEQENTIEKLKPYGADKYFYEDELAEIESKLEEALKREMTKAH